MKFMAKHGLLPLSLLLLALMLRFACAVDSSMNIACGRSGNFTDSQGNIWFGDGDFANLGLAGSVSNYSSVAMPLNTLRYFPGHQLVCYSFSLVPQGTKITVTTKFYYGNYDQNKYSPIFYVKYDSNEWTRIVTNSSAVVAYTQAYTTQYEDVNVCLGTPKDDNINTLFINTLQVSGPGINTRQSKPAMGKFNTDPPLQETKKKPNMAVVVVPIVVIFVLVVIGVVVIFLISRPSRKTQDNNRSAPTGQGPPAPKPANMQGNASPKYSQAPFAEDPSAPGTSNMQRNAASKNSQGNAVAKRLIEINRSFTFAEINKITNNFKTRVGKGGSAVVYYGQLTDGHEVAVKVLSDKGAKVFVSEVQLLLTVHHKSIAAFVGYCEEGENLILMYEYMRGGDLRKLLSGEAKNSELLTWEKRLQIAQTVATGLDYLHSCCRPQIIHRDVKTNNILLNENLEARLADFGLCKESPDDNVAYMSTIVVGTPGYVDPEYYQTNRLTKKSDVYSFGVVLLELISGLSPVFTATDGSHGILVQWARQHLQTNDLESVADPYLGGQYSTESMWKVACTAWACTHQASIERPTMADVVSQLREAMAVQIHHGATHVPCTTPASTPSAWASNGAAFKEISPASASSTDYYR